MAGKVDMGDVRTAAVQELLGESRALRFAVAHGFEVKMAYTLNDTVMYSGIPEATLRKAVREKRLPAKAPNGNIKGCRIPVLAMDEYMAHGDPIKQGGADGGD